MKLSIAVLASVLVACSVTTANPILPSSTTNAEYSTSTGIPSSTTNAEYSTSTDIPSSTTNAEFSTSTDIPSAQVTASIDFSKFSKEVLDLIKEYAKTGKDYDNAKIMHDMLQIQKQGQEMIISQLREKYYKSLDKYQKSGLPRHRDIFKMVEVEFDKQARILIDLVKKAFKLQMSSYGLEIDWNKITTCGAPVWEKSESTS
ncbi:hypothetical protein BDEG_26977 [Batrachochytrium dendrobatidis JEL423]|uniref:Uncharacterized protein n=1 Tax=Batrachochytrium dendrobatidis (strain JEL423) TaxID=403673 RepID=A0A177WVG7_BATDL|nr:hypothetical protein BDEG_26977 [Batrachochytrium dendrobatidis JEL423]